VCKVAQGQVVQEEAEAECSLRNADVVGDTMSMTVRVSPPSSPLDSMDIVSDHSPCSAFIHTHSPSTRLAINANMERGRR
jgi:hypothetical protein